MTRTTPTQRSKLLRQLDAAGFQVRKTLDGHYEHVKPAALEIEGAWPNLDDGLEGGDRISPDA